MGFDPAKNHAGPCWVLYRRRRPFTALDGIANVATTTTAWSLLGRRRVPPPASRNDSVGGRNTLSSIQLRRMVNSIQLDSAIHSKWEFPKKEMLDETLHFGFTIWKLLEKVESVESRPIQRGLPGIRGHSRCFPTTRHQVPILPCIFSTLSLSAAPGRKLPCKCLPD